MEIEAPSDGLLTPINLFDNKFLVFKLNGLPLRQKELTSYKWLDAKINKQSIVAEPLAVY